ncbi:hypothetical protein [Streptomyces sp. NPDC058086]
MTQQAEPTGLDLARVARRDGRIRSRSGRQSGFDASWLRLRPNWPTTRRW